MILHSTRTLLERYRSVLLFMSFMSDEVTMMTSSAEGQMSLMHRYTILRPGGGGGRVHISREHPPSLSDDPPCMPPCRCHPTPIHACPQACNPRLGALYPSPLPLRHPPPQVGVLVLEQLGRGEEHLRGLFLHTQEGSGATHSQVPPHVLRQLRHMKASAPPQYAYLA